MSTIMSEDLDCDGILNYVDEDADGDGVITYLIAMI